MVLVKGGLLRIHVLVLRPRLGNQHRHGVCQPAAGHDEQFERVIKGGGIAAAGLNDGEQLLDIVAEQRRGKDRLAGVHPVDVAAEGVDLTVVRDVAVGVRELPGGEGVGAEALVHEAERADHFGIGQFGVEVGDLGGEEQPFIDDGARGERRHVEEVFAWDIALGDFGFGAFAHEVEFALELGFVHSFAAGDEDLLDVGLRVAGHTADGGAVDGRIAPAEDGEAFFAHDAFDDAFGAEARLRFHGQEGHADAVLAGGRQGEAEFGALAGEELVGDLDEDSGAVAGFGIATAGSSVGQVDEDLDALDDDVVISNPLDVRNEANSAGIVLIARVVEALRLGETSGYRMVAHGYSGTASEGVIRLSGSGAGRRLDLLYYQSRYFRGPVGRAGA